jgi:hypothetical protein
MNRCTCITEVRDTDGHGHDYKLHLNHILFDEAFTYGDGKKLCGYDKH